MTFALSLALLAFVDCVLSGFRAGAGRSGLLDKRAYYRAVVLRSAFWGALLVLVNVAIAVGLCVSAPHPSATWSAFVAAARVLVIVYGTFAALIFAAFGFYFSPLGDFRVLTNVIIFGPLTLLRPWVIVLALAYVAYASSNARVIAIALVAGASISMFERALGRAYRSTWRALVAKK